MGSLAQGRGKVVCNFCYKHMVAEECERFVNGSLGFV